MTARRREVADAIAEHYSPLGPNDRCPTAPVSVAVALADKIDTLVGFFAIGETPTGSKDPFAFAAPRLASSGSSWRTELRLPLTQVFAGRRRPRDALDARAGRDLLAFFADRLKVICASRACATI